MSGLELPHGTPPSVVPQNEKDKNLRNHALTLALGSCERGITSAAAIERANDFYVYINGKVGE